MGVRLLNTFLQTHSSEVTRKMHLRSLRGKRIVVDTSIYMYRFKAANSLIENMYMLCSLFRYYGIHPLFIFDGKNRSEAKKLTLEKRRNQKKVAKKKYDRYALRIEQVIEEQEREKLRVKMDVLRRTFVKITADDLNNIKTLFDVYGIMHRTAEGEADELCAALVIKGTAYACLSEDTDLFAYGCPRVLKYISLINHTTVLYTLSDILNDLDLSLEDFRTMCLFSGTDYIPARPEWNIFDIYNLYKSYVRNGGDTFLNWLSKNKYLKDTDYKKICTEKQRYDNSIVNVLNKTTYFLIRNRVVQHDKLRKLLKTDGFVFPE